MPCLPWSADRTASVCVCARVCTHEPVCVCTRVPCPHPGFTHPLPPCRRRCSFFTPVGQANPGSKLSREPRGSSRSPGGLTPRHPFSTGEEDGRDQSKLETKVWEARNPLVDKQIDQFLVVAR